MDLSNFVEQDFDTSELNQFFDFDEMKKCIFLKMNKLSLHSQKDEIEKDIQNFPKRFPDDEELNTIYEYYKIKKKILQDKLK